jgi:hypothetical protein
MCALEEGRLPLRTGEFYGWIMYPGYVNRPYRSPVRIEQIDQRQEGVFELTFLNILYAAGMQRMEHLLRPLRWEKTYLIAEQLQNRKSTGRALIIEQWTRGGSKKTFLSSQTG